MRTKDFFRKAKESGVKIYRDRPSCNCGACKNELNLGLIVTTEEDIDRLYKEQDSHGVKFSFKNPENGTIFKMRMDKNSKKDRLIQLEKNKKRLEELFLK
jgi:hypothetical protein